MGLRYFGKFIRVFEILFSVVLLILGGSCGDDTRSGSKASGAAELVTNIQQKLPLNEYRSIVDGDSEFQDAVNFADTETGADKLKRAYIVKDENGAELIIGVYANSNNEEVSVVRHCQDGACVAAMQTLVETDEELIWTTPKGEIPVRSMLPPFLLRNINENDPESAVIADITPNLKSLGKLQALKSDSLLSSKQGSSRAASILTLTSGGTKRKLRVGSAFGKHWNVNFKDFVKDMNAAGYDASATHHVSETQVDKFLSGLNKDDVFVLYGHGGLSASKGRVTQMSVADKGSYWWSTPYTEDRMQTQLDANTGDGPGIVFFAGCRTADLLVKFDHSNRIYLGFSDSNYAGGVSKAMRIFFDEWVKGKTLAEAIQTVNDTEDLKSKQIELKVNKSADLNRRCTDPTAEDILGIISGKITNAANGNAVNGALIKLDLSPNPIQRTSTAKGEYILQIPKTITDYFALSVIKGGFVPKVIGVSKASVSSTGLLLDVALTPLDNKTIVVELEAPIHHLGDGSFGGSVNSQFQKATEGLTFTKSFQVTSAHLAFANVTIKMQVKGAECPNLIEINGQVVAGTLSGSPSDGSFGEFSTPLDKTKLREGSNTLTITAKPCANLPDDEDDFEFGGATLNMF